MPKFLLLVIFGAVGIVHEIQAQLPNTDVYLATMNFQNNNAAINSVSLLTHFNKGGYNNQARFFSKDVIYLSVKKSDTSANDIVKLNLKSNELSWVTDTEGISEFSPLPTPDGQHFTTVRIEKDGKDQSLWQYPLDRSGTGKRLFPHLKNIGYYAWISSDSVALFLVGNPNSLVIGRVSTGEIFEVIKNPGRCLRTRENGNLYFVSIKETGKKWLQVLNLKDLAISSIVQLPNEVEDFEITGDGSIFITDGANLKMTTLSTPDTWTVIANLSALDIFKMERPALFGNQLLFVNKYSAPK